MSECIEAITAYKAGMLTGLIPGMLLGFAVALWVFHRNRM